MRSSDSESSLHGHLSAGPRWQYGLGSPRMGLATRYRTVAILVASILLSLLLVSATMVFVHRLVLAIYGYPHSKPDAIWLVKPH